VSAASLPRPRPLHFTAFVTSTRPDPDPAGWRRVLPDQADFDDLERQVRLARTLERGRFDAVVFAGAPGRDPSVLAGAAAYVTSQLGIAVTASVLGADPLSFARRISALDHASNGRIAWNVADDPPGAWTEEYADVTYKLWEGSWDEDALRQDGKVHRINHRGPRYQVTGPHLVSPSPQRTPLLFRAGASEADRAFAARHAEVVLLQSPSPAAAARDTADIRSRAASYGRPARDIKFFQGLRVAAGGTEAEARRKAAELGDQAGDAAPAPGLAAGALIAGTPAQVADELARWQEAGVDGINLVNAGNPGSYEDFVEQVTPVLQGRGLMQREYAEGSLRRKLFGRGDRLPPEHPAARYRGAFTPPSAGKEAAVKTLVSGSA
jgi:alkanesulfonate monooxygenase SsuD/methylene tetrahydromethanopterin reductase-like flavin-dependent oxidoreductase (luciferase family)